VNRFLDAAIASGDYQRWEEAALSSPSPRGRGGGVEAVPAVPRLPLSPSAAAVPVAAVVLAVAIAGLLLLALRSGGGAVIFCCCTKRLRGGSYAGLPTDTTDAEGKHYS